MPIERWCSILLLAIIFEGALRKWLLPASLHPLAYGAKDIIIAFFIIKHPLKNQYTLLRRLRSATIACASLLIPSLLAGWAVYPAAALMTLTNAVVWPVFAFHLAGSLTPAAIAKLTKKLAFLAIAMCILAAIQFALPPTHFLNHYAWNAMGIDFEAATVTAHSGVRATGTFSYITGLTSFATFGFAWFTWQFLSGRSNENRLWTLSACFASVVSILASGSRGPLIYCAVCLLSVLIATRRFKTLLQLSIFACVCIAGIQFLPNQKLISSYVERANTSTDTFATRAIEPITWFITQVQESPMGDGLGQHSQLVTLSGSQNIGTATMNSHEDGRARAASEAGLLGICCFFGMLLVLSDYFFLCMKNRSVEIRTATGALGPVILLSVFGCLWYDHVATALWWFAAGAWLSISVWTQPTHPVRSSRGPAFAHDEDRLRSSIR